jgi:hypothetical protein
LPLPSAEYHIHELFASFGQVLPLPIFIRVNGNRAVGKIPIAIGDGGLQRRPDFVDADEQELALSIFHGLILVEIRIGLMEILMIVRYADWNLPQDRFFAQVEYEDTAIPVGHFATWDDAQQAATQAFRQAIEGEAGGVLT